MVRIVTFSLPHNNLINMEDEMGWAYSTFDSDEYSLHETLVDKY